MKIRRVLYQILHIKDEMGSGFWNFSRDMRVILTSIGDIDIYTFITFRTTLVYSWSLFQNLRLRLKNTVLLTHWRSFDKLKTPRLRSKDFLPSCYKPADLNVEPNHLNCSSTFVFTLWLFVKPYWEIPKLKV